MRSRTSYFNATLFCKTVTRFWPIWFFYFAVWFVAMPMVIYSNLRWGGTSLRMQANVCSGASTLGVIFGMIAACVAAMAVWSFMYSARSASATACLPIRREGVFLSVSLGGIAPLLAVNALIFLLSLGAQAVNGAADIQILAQWLCAVSLQLVFYYGFALVCAQLTGNLVVLPLVYLVLNFTVYVLERVISSVLSSFVYGAPGSFYSDILLALTPPLCMLTHFTRQSVWGYNAGGYEEPLRYYLAGWGTLFVYAAAGLALAALALWLYRRRRMESAGDVVAVSILRPVFKYCMTFGCAICIGTMLYELTFDGGYGLYGAPGGASGQWPALAILTALMLAGAFIGYFASEMLMRKSFRVWHGHWAGLGVSALIIAALMLSVELDLFGYERRVPDPDTVANVYVYTGSYYYYTANSGGTAALCEPENIASAVRLHRSIVANKDWYEKRDWRDSAGDGDYRSVNLNIDYELKNGRHVMRRYDNLGFLLSDPSTQADALAAQELMNTPEAIIARKSPGDFLPEIINSSVSARILPGDIEKAAETTGEVYDNGDRVALHTGGSASTGVIGSEYGSRYDDGYLTAVWDLTNGEAEELYTQCIVPDMADGTIGTVWIVADEKYENTVYAVQIRIDMRQQVISDNGAEWIYKYNYFYTVPTVNSVRTNRWLADHGVVLRTIAEAGEL